VFDLADLRCFYFRHREVNMTKVNLAVGKLEVANVQTAPEFRVTDDGGSVIGDLRISKGGAFWRPKGAEKYLHLNWSKLDGAFRERGEPKAVGEYNYAPPPPASFDEF
jgi:hypothetical protein